MAAGHDGQLLGAMYGPEMSRSQCRFCGANKAALCHFNGLGFRRRRHERRCEERQRKAAGITPTAHGEDINHPSSSASGSNCFRGQSSSSDSRNRLLDSQSCSTEHAAGATADSSGTADSFAEYAGSNDAVASSAAASNDKKREQAVLDSSRQRTGLRGRARTVLQALSSGRRRGSRSPPPLDAQAHAGSASPRIRTVSSDLVSTASSASIVVAPAAVAAAAVWLEAPMLAGSFFLATAALWTMRRREIRRDATQASDQSSLDHSTGTRPACAREVLVQQPVSTVTTATSAVAVEVSRLVHCFCVRQAIALAEANGLLGSPSVGCEPVEVQWLRHVAPLVLGAEVALQIPPAAGAGASWMGPLESSGDRWQMSLWYRWTGPSMLSTLTQLSVPGTIGQCLSIFREADLVHNWLPFVNSCTTCPSENVPALLGTITAKIPILPRSINTLIHRAFVDCDGSSDVLLVDWTPPPDELGPGQFCGMLVPEGSFNMTVKLATTLVRPDGEGRCSIVMNGENDFKVSRRLLPDVIVRKFLAMNSKVLAQRICSCLEDQQGKGYQQRIESDPQGFYRNIEQRVAETTIRQS